MGACARPAWPLTVYYDGACRVCAAEIAHYRRQPHGGRLRFVDISSAAFRAEEHGLKLEEFRRQMQIRDARGEFRSGVDAFVMLWQALPGRRYRWLAKGVDLPVLRTLTRWGYVRFARYRHLLPKRRQCDDQSCPRPPDKN